MEHRYYPRIPVSLEVDMFRRDKHLGHGQTRDISLGGMMLKNDRTVLKRNDVIAMRIWINGVERVFRGLVIHTSEKQAGIMLIDLDKETLRTIFNFLRDMEVPLRMALGSYETTRPID
jgi:hypothetical protein